MNGLEVLGLFAAVGDLGKHFLERDALIDHHHGQVIEQVGDFVDGLHMITVFRGNNGLCALLIKLDES